MLKFHCPNGHPLSAPANLAGRPGKCPKCNAPFVVPSPDDVAPGPPADPAAPAAVAQAPVLPAMGSGKANAVEAGEIFVFLCPNGHKLNGPPSLKGKAGQCPHCGARFRIPTDEELEEELSEDVEPLAGDGVDNGGDIDFNRLFGGEGAAGIDEELPEAMAGELVGPPPPGAGGLGYIVARLWERRTDDTELEVFLSEGEIVAPDFYSEILSSSDYGVFAIQEGDGSYAVTVIPWNTVRRVGMRRVDDLPPELFE
jgi:hypothetical protein